MPCTVIYYHRLQFPSESGQTIQVLRDYHALASLGHTVHLIYHSEYPLTRSEETAALLGYGLDPVPTFHLHPIAENRHNKKNLREAVKHIIDTTQCSAFFLLTRTLGHARAALALSKKIGRPVAKVVLEMHETAIPHMVYQEQGRQLRALVSRFTEKLVFSALDGIICTVGPQLSLLDSLYPNHAPVAILPNGVPARLLNLLPHRKNGVESVHLGYAGQLNSWKNIDIMIESLKFLPPHFVLDIAGGKKKMEQQTRDYLMKCAKQSSVEGRVNYFGFLLPSEVPEFISGMDILLLPLGNNAQSRSFTSPMKLFEYAASGIPMVVTRQPTTASLVEDGIHALMAEPGSAKSMAEAINTLVTTPGLGNTLASNAKKWVAQHTYDKRAMHLVDFLNSVGSS